MLGYTLFWFYTATFIYAFGIFVFKLYIKLSVFEDALCCYLCKEMDDFENLYDYIIVGSGTAGSIIASRLAVSNSTKILLLEAGTQAANLYNIPAIGPLLQQSSVDWQYKTVSQKNACLSLDNNASIWPMGKVVGGTSRLNNMIYTRGHLNDYKWLSEFYERDILPYFKKNEKQIGNFTNSKYHSTLGYLPVQDMRYSTELANATLEAAKSLGYTITDLNGNVNIGFMLPQINILDGQRWTTADVLQNRCQINVRLQTNALVTKILLRNNFHAYGVEFSYLNEIKRAEARLGIILSAGVIGTPKILMHSGIGPKDHLKQTGIKPKIDLPVGDNLQDHVATGLDLIILDKQLPISVANMLNPVNAYDYFFNGKGPWTTTGAEVVAVLDSGTESDFPDLELMTVPAGLSSDGGKHFQAAISVNISVWQKYFVPLYGKQTVTISPSVLHPKSKGTVRLRDNSFSSSPLIDPNYLSDERDVDVLVKGIEIVKKLIKTEPMRKLGARLNETPFPGCENFHFDTDAYWKCYVRHLTCTSYHPVGTCSMGKVVDNNFRVFGTSHLYVADASIFPQMPSGNINAPVMMVAEMAVDSIKNQIYLTTGVSLRKNVLVPKMQCVFNRYLL